VLGDADEEDIFEKIKRQVKENFTEVKRVARRRKVVVDRVAK
jgi:hypothetical protein